MNETKEIGLVGKHNAKSARQNFGSLNVKKVLSFDALPTEREKARRLANSLIRETENPEDILDWTLPENLPGDVVYDGLLKRQRQAVVDLTDPNLTRDVCEAITNIFVAQRVLESANPQLVLVSHIIEFSYGILSWVAVRHRIPVILLFGQLGVVRFVKVTSSDEFYEFMDCAKGDELSTLPEKKANTLETLGSRFLEKRLAGKHGDLGSVYAYRNRTGRIDRTGLVERFSWDADKPIISVYAANWFDYPHGCGMSNFRDFLDWIEVTLDAATQNPDVQWLFKAHPCDEWYGGVTLEDLISVDEKPHIQLMPKEWSGRDIIDCSDALVTVHSTAAIEFAALQRPVLVADRGWYNDCGFCTMAATRQDYISRLKTRWWTHTDIEECARRAKIFAGLYFGRPDWQNDFIQLDDSSGDILYESHIRLLNESNKEISQEIETLRNWFEGANRRYHTFKMLNAENYTSEYVL